jgi:hypothetical protein
MGNSYPEHRGQPSNPQLLIHRRTSSDSDLCYKGTHVVEARSDLMHILRIEHEVTDYENWKQAFDNDPLGRKRSGVRSYRVLRAVDDPNFVMIDLEFDTAAEAGQMQIALEELWGRVNVMRDPQSRAAEIVETGSY